MNYDKHILIVAGEPSGDLYGGKLAGELWRLEPGLTLNGVGGEKMAQAGVKLYFDIVELAGIGITEVLKNIARLHKIFRQLAAIIKKERPKAVILIDFPEFNLRLAKKINKLKIPVIYYISPQIWAWRRGRIKTISRYIKKMLVVFPFEQEFYKKLNVPVEFVGHPLLDTVSPSLDKKVVKMNLGIEPGKIIIGLFPGSRESEVKRHLPIMLKAAKIISEEIPQAEFIIAVSSHLSKKLFANMMTRDEEMLVRLIDGQTSRIMKAAELILVASGTATLEAACYSCPMIIIYKISFLTWLFVRPLIKVPYVGLVNLIAKEKIVPEYLQFQAKPEKIAKECLNLVKNEKKRRKMVENLRLVRRHLGEPGASKQAARAVLNTVFQPTAYNL